MPNGLNKETGTSTGGANPQQELFRQLNESPIVDILGVVDANGVGALKSQAENLWTLLVSLVAWKYPGEALQNQKLTIRKNEVTNQELDSTREAIQPYDVIFIRARLAEHNVYGIPQGLLVKIVGKHPSDDELNRHAHALQEPVTFEDDDFGLFTLDRRVNWYEAETTWGETSIKLRLAMDGCEHPDRLLAQARSLWNSQRDWSQRIADYAVTELLALKNEFWLEEDEQKVTAEQFKSRMTMESITIYHDGQFEFSHDDDDLFGGHSILVSGNLTDGPTLADISG